MRRRLAAMPRVAALIAAFALLRGWRDGGLGRALEDVRLSYPPPPASNNVSFLDVDAPPARATVDGELCGFADRGTARLAPPTRPVPRYALTAASAEARMRRLAAHLAGELKRDGLLDARKSDGGGGHVSMQDQDGYAYLLSVEGHCGFADRDKHVFWMGPTLFHQESFCEEYYVLAATPWVHYVPVAYDYHNLRAAVAWANAHPRDVATIAANARDFAATWLTSTGIVAYFRALLLEIANATRYDVAARLGDGSGFVPAAAYLKPDRGKPGAKGAKQKAEEETIIV